MPPEIEEIRAWLVKAQHDWLAARHLLTPDCVVLDIVAFHCQQAVEKVLKSFLVSRGIEFEKTHDLGWLLDLCVGADADLDGLRPAVRPLSAYAIVFRYPGPAELTRTQAERAIAVVQQVWDFVTQRLPHGALP